MSDKKSDILTDKNSTSEQLSAWERWQLPNMEGDLPRHGNAYNLHTPKRLSEVEAEHLAEPEIKPPTADEIEAIRTTAHEEGYKEGVEAGKAEGFKAGFASGESDLKATITRLGQICRVLLEPIPKQDEELEQAVLEMVEKVCRRVVHRELSLDSSSVIHVVREALDCINPGARRIRIHLNPVDADFVIKKLREADEFDDSWRVLAHPTITPGGCIVETDTSLIDARAEKRLASMLQQVYEQQHHALDEKAGQQGHVDQLLGEVASFTPDELTSDGLEQGDSDDDPFAQEPPPDVPEP